MRVMRLSVQFLMVVVAGVFGMGVGITAATADPPPWAGSSQNRSGIHHHGGSHDRGDDHQVNRRTRGHDHYQISTREQFYIKDWYRRHGHRSRHQPHALPPVQVENGQVKKLYRGAPWPPPYAYEPLPVALVRTLQPLPPGYRYYQVGADVVIANLAGRVVTDVVYNLLNR